MTPDDDEILLSSLQHIEFCERQWWLIYVERVWRDNVLTVEGKAMHEYVHREGAAERSGLIVARAMQLRSVELSLYGVADLIEFVPNESGSPLPGRRGRYTPYPIEYKHGRKRPDLADEMQLTAQALCLEEMFSVAVHRGAIFYGKPKRRTEVDISQALRIKVGSLCERVRELSSGAAQPSPRIGRHCSSCSLADICMPGVISADTTRRYLAEVTRYAADT